MKLTRAQFLKALPAAALVLAGSHRRAHRTRRYGRVDV